MLDFADFNILRIQLMCANDAALWYRQELSVALKRFFLNGRLDISLLEMPFIYSLSTLSPEVHKINQVRVQIFSCPLTATYQQRRKSDTFLDKSLYIPIYSIFLRAVLSTQLDM